MRSIAKGVEPASLTTHKRTKHCDYDNYADKGTLRLTLVAEQRGICCYCMGRIRADVAAMKIEHWHCRNNYAAEQLNYSNLLGACLGGEGKPPHLQHCDTKKGDLELRWNPANPVHHIETRIRYELDGSIRAEEAEFDAQLNDVLNLNLQVLKNSRKGVLNAVLDWWKHEKARIRGPVPRERLERERERRTRDADPLEPFCQVAVWWLEQRLARMPA